MTATTHSSSRNRLGRMAVLTMVDATLFTGLLVTPAQAARREWWVIGPYRVTIQEAVADIPTVEARCRRQDGVVYNSVVLSVNAPRFAAGTYCQGKRG